VNQDWDHMPTEVFAKADQVNNGNFHRNHIDQGERSKASGRSSVDDTLISWRLKEEDYCRGIVQS